MTHPVRGLAEMARVARLGGTVAACVWDYGGRRSPLDPFWAAAHDITPGLRDETGLPGARQGHLEQLFAEAGLPDADSAELTVEVRHASFEDWWEPYTLGVGPAGAHVPSLSLGDRQRLQEHCRAQLPEPPFTSRAVAPRGTCDRVGLTLTGVRPASSPRESGAMPDSAPLASAMHPLRVDSWLGDCPSGLVAD